MNTALVVARVVDALLIKVSHVDCLVGSNLNVNRAEPCIACCQRMSKILGFERRSMWLNIGHDDTALERLDAKKFSAVAFREIFALINDERVRKPLHVVVRHVREVAKRVGIGQLAVLTKSFPKVPTLHVVEAARVATIVSRINAALRIDFDAKGVAAAFREDLILTGFGPTSDCRSSR